jgi:hypothetical protein
MVPSLAQRHGLRIMPAAAAATMGAAARQPFCWCEHVPCSSAPHTICGHRNTSPGSSSCRQRRADPGLVGMCLPRTRPLQCTHHIMHNRLLPLGPVSSRSTQHQAAAAPSCPRQALPLILVATPCCPGCVHQLRHHGGRLPNTSSTSAAARALRAASVGLTPPPPPPASTHHTRSHTHTMPQTHTHDLQLRAAHLPHTECPPSMHQTCCHTCGLHSLLPHLKHGPPSSQVACCPGPAPSCPHGHHCGGAAHHPQACFTDAPPRSDCNNTSTRLRSTHPPWTPSALLPARQ